MASKLTLKRLFINLLLGVPFIFISLIGFFIFISLSSQEDFAITNIFTKACTFFLPSYVFLFIIPAILNGAYDYIKPKKIKEEKLEQKS